MHSTHSTRELCLPKLLHKQHHHPQRDQLAQNFSSSFFIMRHSFIRSVLHLSTFAFLTAATPTGWNQTPSKNCRSFDLNEAPAEEIPSESISSFNEPIASFPAVINPSRYNTPEELAANFLVFPGLPGPNPSASVQSASSHGRHHREYPLGQQSSSSKFSSTSPGQHKTSDSSTGLTSRRYKKVGTSSHRYKPYNVINQHSTPQNSVSDVIPTSSKPGYVLPTENNPTRDAVGIFKEKELAGCTGLSTNKRAGERLFNVYDWEFLREDPEREKSDDHLYPFLRHLNQCKGTSDLESFFFIQRDRAIEFLNTFTAKNQELEFNLPLEIHKGRRFGMLFATLLKLSDRKINLEGYPFFKEEIIEVMRQRLFINWKTTPNPVSRQRIETIVKFVGEVTKVTQLLIVAQLSLFKEHEPEGLTDKEVEKHLRFLQELWLQIDMGTPDIQEHDWAMKAHQLFKFQIQKRHVFDSVAQKEKMYNFAWNLAHYWREKTGKSLRGSYGPQHMASKLKELVGKIIFFSNYQAYTSSI